ncbi:hypothetical protein D3C71_1766070 [compost metagenome]
MDVVFTGPLHPYRLAGKLLGEHGRFDDKVGFGLASETAAQQRDVHRDLLERNAQAFSDTFTGHLRGLARCPGLALAVLEPGNGNHRLHR